MIPNLPTAIDRDAPIFVISTAAHLAGMHPQTLRQYDRLGLVVPQRARGRGRRYSRNDIAKLLLIQHLSQDEGINLPGIRRILELEDRVRLMGEQITLLTNVVRSVDEHHSRVFTADEYGGVNLGRAVRRPRGELLR